MHHRPRSHTNGGAAVPRPTARYCRPILEEQCRTVGPGVSRIDRAPHEQSRRSVLHADNDDRSNYRLGSSHDVSEFHWAGHHRLCPRRDRLRIASSTLSIRFSSKMVPSNSYADIKTGNDPSARRSEVSIMINGEIVTYRVETLFPIRLRTRRRDTSSGNRDCTEGGRI